MIIQHGLAKAGYTGYASPSGGAQNTKSARNNYNNSGNAEVKSSEHKLSGKAADFLAKLRSERSDFDFIIADAGDDHKALVKQSDKEFTVVYTSAELERMASDPKFAAEKEQAIETTLRMTKKICDSYGYVSVFGKNTENSANAPVDANAKTKIDGFLMKQSELYAKQTAWAMDKVNDGKQAALEIYRRMARGALVSPADEQSLMGFDPNMYQAAKMAQQMAKKHEDLSDDSLTEDFNKRHANDRTDYTSELNEYIGKMNKGEAPAAESEAAYVGEALDTEA